MKRNIVRPTLHENLSDEEELLNYDIKIGDIVGNTVQGFNFKVLAIEDKLHGLKVKNLITGEIFNTTYQNMRKRTNI